MLPRVMLDAYVVLQDRDLTDDELSREVHCHRRTAGRVLAQMRGMGLAHVVGWIRRQGSAVPVYRFGIGEEAEKPAPMNNKERKASSAKKLSVEDRDFAAARRRQLRRKVKVDALTAAFFGVKK